jgi:hypothetical protein
MRTPPSKAGGALDWAKLMDYNVIIITDADFSDDPAFVHPFRASTIADFNGAVGKAIAEWRCNNPDRNFLEAGCTVLIEKAMFAGAAQAAADEVRTQIARR